MLVIHIQVHHREILGVLKSILNGTQETGIDLQDATKVSAQDLHAVPVRLKSHLEQEVEVEIGEDRGLGVEAVVGVEVGVIGLERDRDPEQGLGLGQYHPEESLDLGRGVGVLTCVAGHLLK